MNRSAEIIDYLTKHEGMDSILMIPSAPPIVKTADGIAIALTVVLTAEDVNDTLMALKAQAPHGHPEESGSAGTFSFGLRKVGRFRVTHATQRGTKVLSIARIPSTLPSLDAMTQDVEVAHHILDFLVSGRGGALAVYGPRALTNSLLIYSLINAVNSAHRKLVYILERSLTFLMQHDNSVVIQRELGSDVPDLDTGVRNGLLFAPDILVVSTIRSTDVIPSVQCAVDAGITVVGCSDSMNGTTLLARMAPEIEHVTGLRALAKHAVKVSPEPSNRCRLCIDPAPERPA
jgi:twitching motility protein PilT